MQLHWHSKQLAVVAHGGRGLLAVRAFIALSLPFVCHCSDASTSVLILGDSYSAANGGLDAMLRNLFSSAGDHRRITAVVHPGADFEWHAGQAAIFGTADNEALKAGSSKGYVVLQDRSHVPAFCCNGPDTDYYGEFVQSIEALPDLDSMAKDIGAAVILLQTWGRRDGAPEPFLPGFVEMNELVKQGYEKYAKILEKDGRKPLVAPVGQAFRLLYDTQALVDTHQHNSTFRNLYAEDGSHPSALGSYLAACVLYATISKSSPVGLPSEPGISESQRDELQASAHTAVFGTEPPDRKSVV